MRSTPDKELPDDDSVQRLQLLNLHRHEMHLRLPEGSAPAGDLPVLRPGLQLRRVVRLRQVEESGR